MAKKKAIGKVIEFPFLGEVWTLELKPLGDDASCWGALIRQRTILINTSVVEDIVDTIHHELTEIAYARRGVRYVNGQDEIVFCFTHREFTNASEDVSSTYAGILKGLKLI